MNREPQGESMKGDGFGHEIPHEGQTNDWITPPWVIEALGGPEVFDLDPCMSLTQPWATASKGFTVEQNGLAQQWWGNVWLNPPYGPHTYEWVKRLSEHGKGIALIFARTETSLWQDHIFTTAHGFLFPRRRIQFARPNGTFPKSSSGAPSALIAWGSENRARLIEAVDNGSIPGAFCDMAFYTGSKRVA
jgi:hypothetical protein